MCTRRCTRYATPVTDFQDYESRLRAEIAHEATQVEAAWASLHASDAHPMSVEYKALQRLALMTSGTLTGLLAALALLSDEDVEQEYTEKLNAWMRGRN